MKIYESLFIVQPELEESEVDKTIDLIQEVITTGGGKILNVDKWGRRQLAYMIQNKQEGFYVLMHFEAPATLINELYRRFKLTDAVMRYLVIQLSKKEIEDMLQKLSAHEAEVEASNAVVEDDESASHDDVEPDEELVASTEE